MTAMTLRHVASLCALALLPALAAPAAAARTYSLTGDDVAIWNPAGEVHIEATSGNAVEVEVSPMGRDASQLTINDQPLGGRPTLRVLYPHDRIVYPPMGRWSNTNTNIRSDGTWGADNHGMSWLGRRITVHGGGSGTEAWTDLVVRVPKGRKVSVYSLAGAGEIRNVDGRLLFDGGSGGVQVEKCRGTLTLDLGSGSVQVAGFDGELNVDTGSGGVRVSDVNGARVHLDTGSGSVTGDGVTTDDLLVDTGSGSVDMSQVDAKRAKIDTGSGGVDLGLTSRTSDLDIDTGSGSVRVTVPSDFSARLHIETGSGGIHSDLPVSIEEKDTGLLRGTVGSGTGRLHVDTGSGGVSLLAGGTTRTKAR
jgi:lia operon protein LiaG